MNARIFWRLIWKEYRIERAFWISMAALAVFMELLLLASASFVHDTRWAVGGSQRMAWLFGFALAFPAFYALGCGATMFAVERETGTFEFQRMLPVTAARLFWGKLALAALSTLAMIALLWPTAIALAGGRTPGYNAALGLWALWGFAAVELLVWGVFFSLVSSQPLKATILAAASASLGVHLVTSFFVRSGYDYLNLTPYTAALLPRAAIAATVAIADVWLGSRWFREKVSPWPVTARERHDEESQAAGRLDARAMTGRTAGFGRLVWQAWRQSGTLFTVLVVTLLPCTLFLVAASVSEATATGNWRHSLSTRLRASEITPIFMLLAMSAPVFAGVCVFLTDQRRQGFRFLAERGARPTLVWLSRQVVPVLALLFSATALGIALACALCLKAVGDLRDLEEYFRLVGTLAGYGVLAYAAGQLASMVFRSGILAAVFGLVLAGLLSIWAGLMWAGGVPLVWSVAPIPLVLLAVTWVRTPNWLRERGGLRGWLPTGLVLAVPAVALAVAVPCYRVYSVPLVLPGFSPQEYDRPRTAAEKATLDLYRKAWQGYSSSFSREKDEDGKAHTGGKTAVSEGTSAKTTSRLATIEESIELAIAASRRTDCNCFDPLGRDPVFGHMGNLAQLIISDGQWLENEGKLGEALDRYVAALRISGQLRERASYLWSADSIERTVYARLLPWSTRPGQTAERVRMTVAQIDEATAHLPSRTDPIKSEYFVMRAAIGGDAEAMQQLGANEEEIVHRTLWLRLVPGERARAYRVLNLITSAEITRLGMVESYLAEGKQVDPSLYRIREDEFQRHWEAEDWLLRRSSLYWQQTQAARDLLNMATRRRAVRVLLAIEAWKLEHDALPKTLDELVGPYLDRLPLDPYSAEPFHYFPQGLPVRMVPPEQRDWDEEQQQGVVKAGTPMIWSAGPLVFLESAPGARRDWARIYRSLHSTEWHRPAIELDVWQAGWAFAVP